MKNSFVITMWTGSGPAKKWKSYETPTLLPQGTGVEFINAETRLKVRVIGNISVEEYESGVEEIESMRSDWAAMTHQNTLSHSEFCDEPHSESHSKNSGPSDDTDNKIHRLF